MAARSVDWKSGQSTNKSFKLRGEIIKWSDPDYKEFTVSLGCGYLSSVGNLAQTPWKETLLDQDLFLLEAMHVWLTGVWISTSVCCHSNKIILWAKIWSSLVHMWHLDTLNVAWFAHQLNVCLFSHNGDVHLFFVQSQLFNSGIIHPLICGGN